MVINTNGLWHAIKRFAQRLLHLLLVHWTA